MTVPSTRMLCASVTVATPGSMLDNTLVIWFVFVARAEVWGWTASIFLYCMASF